MDKTRPASLDKMIALVATLVERSRGPDLRLQLSPRDYNAIAGGKVSGQFTLFYFQPSLNKNVRSDLTFAICCIL